LLSLRHKTNDHLWFAFFHEIAHILKHKKQLFLEEKKEFSNDKKFFLLKALQMILVASISPFLSQV
jgi:hypothetical protein